MDTPGSNSKAGGAGRGEYGFGCACDYVYPNMRVCVCVNGRTGGGACWPLAHDELSHQLLQQAGQHFLLSGPFQLTQGLYSIIFLGQISSPRDCITFPKISPPKQPYLDLSRHAPGAWPGP